MHIDDIYPYDKDPDRHPLSWVFFNAGFALTLDAAEKMAKHVFEDLGCGGPGSAHPPVVKYDAVGSSGAPWEPGVWIPFDEPRMSFVATAPDKDITAMSAEERAELREALAVAESMDAAKRHSDVNEEG
ncbi:TPA: hypothetical protein NJV68_002435 [Corynebacterium striatum]|uniref:phage gene 29 protein family protein n=1 Tax=Corynebacterium striatum TaxID=43770 RepID=UPI001CB75CB4|nr:hypothetical protein [Corynebacterium striatum]MDK8809085.1 hypothetical protein [Corynebacterium striatum]HCD3016523.1 hypothetical protein [Corynebacterium striatum]HCG2975742.1 hypothetical protein [Corynebacterium striatum]HCG2988403.1 hypothetical protein [Corynebacterium striatum]HCG3145424.1 hypothetical protein [Corynebacterium striatum]